MTTRLTTPPDYVPGHGDRTYVVRHYDLALDYKVDGNHLRGVAKLEIEALAELDEFVLDLHALKVSKLTVNGAPARHRVKGDRLHIRPRERVLVGSQLVVTVAYAGQPRPVRNRQLGTAGWEELTDGALVASQPHGSPSWFPCNDRPGNKASYRISLTVPHGYTALANGALVEQHHHAGGMTWTYEQDEPMATYLATVHVGRYDRVGLEGPIECFALVPPALKSKLATGFGRQGEMIRLFVDRFGPYPYSAYGVVVTEDELEIPLEAQGFSTFGANFLSEDWEEQRLVAHELAHQWFGNCVTASTWNDIWLHEGFACYAEWLWSEESGGPSAHEQAELHHERLAAKPQDLILADPGVELMFDDRVYKRGALLLHALRLTIGEPDFVDLLRDWVRLHAHGSVSTTDFMGLAERSVLIDLTDLFRTWLFQAELPALPPTR